MSERWHSMIFQRAFLLGILSCKMTIQIWYSGSKKWANIWHLMGGDTYSFSLVLRLSREHCKTSIWPNVTQLPRNFLAKWVKGPIFQLHWLLSSKSKKRSIFQYLWFRDDTGCLNSRVVQWVLVQIFSPFSLQYGNHPPVTLLQQQGMRVQTHLLQRTSYWANRNRILYERGTRPETRLSR